MRKADNQQSSPRRNAEDNEPILTERMVGIHGCFRKLIKDCRFCFFKRNPMLANVLLCLAGIPLKLCHTIIDR